MLPLLPAGALLNFCLELQRLPLKLIGFGANARPVSRAGSVALLLRCERVGATLEFFIASLLTGRLQISGCSLFCTLSRFSTSTLLNLRLQLKRLAIQCCGFGSDAGSISGCLALALLRCKLISLPLKLIQSSALPPLLFGALPCFRLRASACLLSQPLRFRLRSAGLDLPVQFFAFTLARE